MKNLTLTLAGVLFLFSGCTSPLPLMDGTEDPRISQDRSLLASMPLPETDPADGWEWWTPDGSSWFVNHDLAVPFSINGYEGMDQNNQSCEPKDGWVLYIRRVTYDDFKGRITGDPNGSLSVPDANKFFVLYNRDTGDFRTFIYRSQNSANASYCSIVTRVPEVQAFDSEKGYTIPITDKDPQKYDLESDFLTDANVQGKWLE